MVKRLQSDFEKNEKIYVELAEKRTVEMLGLTESQVVYAKAFETTKAVELSNIKNEVLERQRKKLTVWSVLWKL